MLSYSSKVRFVLVSPSHPGNIGAAARAIKTMGFGELVVVAPHDDSYRSAPEAIALATGAADVLADSHSFASLVDALHGVTVAYAMTGYDREFGPRLLDARAAAGDCATRLEGSDSHAAFVFGTERSGLTNVDIERCQFCCAIPANPEFPSLNLAQAVQVMAYECQLALRATAAIHSTQRRFAADERPASIEALEGFYRHLKKALTAVGAHNPAEPKRLMQRLMWLFTRAQPTQTEIDLLRGVTSAIIESRIDRAGRKRSM
jgi:tRNA/rRNA methyltransferase